MEIPTDCVNVDIAHLYNLTDKVLGQVIQCEAANAPTIKPSDIDRFVNYVNILQKSLEHVKDDPEVDRTKSHPEPEELRSPTAIANVTNPFIQRIAMLFRIARDEVLWAESRKMGAGLGGPDAKRFAAHLSKVEKYLDDFLSAFDPDSDDHLTYDFPENDPSSVASSKK